MHAGQHDDGNKMHATTGRHDDEHEIHATVGCLTTKTTHDVAGGGSMTKKDATCRDITSVMKYKL
jgi:hypothetical protein